MPTRNVLIVHDSKPCGPLLEHVGSSGVGLHLAVPRDADWARDCLDADRIIVTDPFSATPLLSDVLAYEAEQGMRFDAVGAYCEFCVATAADVAQALGLPGLSPGAARRSSVNKALMRRTCQEGGVPTPRWSLARGLGAAALRRAADAVGYPCVVKPVFGRDSLGAFRLCSPQDCERAGEIVRASWNASAASGAFSMFTGLYIVEQYVAGPLVSVDGLVDGAVIDIAGVIEVGMGPEPWFSQQTNWLPPRLAAASVEAAADLVRAVVRVLGLDRCVFHAEVRCSEPGPLLIEIAPRPAGGHIPAAYRRVYDIDLHHAQLSLWLGEHPRFAAGAPRRHIIQQGVFPSSSGRVVSVDGFEAARKLPGVWQFTAVTAPGQDIQTYPATPVPFYYYAVEGRTASEADALADAVTSQIKIVTAAR